MRPGRAERPVHHSEVLWMATKAPRVRLCGIWTLPRANATLLCQVLGSRQENPPTCTEISTKLQNKGHIHGSTKQQRLHGIGLNGVYYVALKPQGLRKRWKSGLCFTFQEKGHRTVTLGEIQSPCALIYHSDCHSTLCLSPSELKTLLEAQWAPFVSHYLPVPHSLWTALRITESVMSWKGCLEKKYPLIEFTHPLTSDHLKKGVNFHTWIKGFCSEQTT